MPDTSKRRAFAAGIAISGILTTGMIAAAPAMATTTSRTAPAAVHLAAVRRHVCAQSLYVREAPAGRAIGTLYNGETFDEESSDSGGVWFYGMAYGHVNAHGWVLAQYLC
jgi:hypothetical protein